MSKGTSRPEPVTEPVSLRRGAVFRAHLGKGCASSKESPAFSKMRTSKKCCASSNTLRTFEAGPRPCTRCRSRVKSCRHLLRPRSRCFQTHAHKWTCRADVQLRTWHRSALGPGPCPGETKKAAPGSLILARLRISATYSLWLYRISSFFSPSMPDAGRVVQDQYSALFAIVPGCESLSSRATQVKARGPLPPGQRQWPSTADRERDF